MARRRSSAQRRALRERQATQRASAPAGADSRPVSRSTPRPRPAPRLGRRRSFWSGPYPYVGFLGAVVAVVLVIVIVGHVATTAKPPPTTGNQDAVRLVTSVPASAFNEIGIGSVTEKSSPLQVLTSSAPSLSDDGKPELLYVGAEWCPYCAAERWVLITALSRFGTLTGLRLITSSGSDVYPYTPTFTFTSASYKSSYLSFAPVEYQDRDHNSLQTFTPEQESLVQRYDPGVETIPFLYLAGRYGELGASFGPADLSGRSQGEIARNLHQDAGAASTRDILSNANVLTAAICQTTGGDPSAVCQSPAVQAAEGVVS